jgi:hypothetical protein
MFYLAEAFLDGEGLAFSSHSAVIGEFGRIFAKSGRMGHGEAGELFAPIMPRRRATCAGRRPLAPSCDADYERGPGARRSWGNEGGNRATDAGHPPSPAPDLGYAHVLGMAKKDPALSIPVKADTPKHLRPGRSQGRRIQLAGG